MYRKEHEMLREVLFLSAALATAYAVVSYERTGDCEATHENLYKYYAKEDYFGDDIDQTFEITMYFRIYCKSVGMLGDKRAKLYDMVFERAILGGNVVEREESNNAIPDYNEKMKGLFHFVQTEDGSIPVTIFSREEDREIVNIKKAVVSAFQANFEGSKFKEEADPQSLHKSEYSYEASLQDIQDGVIRMHRKVTSENVEGYASHIPGEEVELNKDEDMVFKRGILTQARGTTSVKLMTQENREPEDDNVEDILEAEYRRKRDMITPEDPNEIKTFDPNMKTNHYESEGSYTLELVGQRRLLRQRRSGDPMDLTQAVESSLLAFINHTRKAMEQMMELHYDLGDILQSLRKLQMNPNNTAIAHKIETLVKLEAKFGPLPQYSPAIETVLEYLKQILGSSSMNDIKMRMLIYFIISPEGSLSSQLALLEGLERAVNDEEFETIIIYIAMVANPHPQLIARLETLISSDVHSGDPLLLAYGGIISRASPELQQRMTLFLTNRLPQAEANNTSLIHHILSLGNAASPRIADFLIDYLDHPEIDVQLTSILAMRFIMSEPSVLKSLKDLLIRPETNEDHVTMIAKALLYGTERAKLNYQDLPYSYDFAEALVMLAMNIDNGELHSALISYLKAIKTRDSKDLLQLLMLAKATKFDVNISNNTRVRRGTRWDENNAVYNLVAPLGERQADVREYQNKLSYIWGKAFGGGDINAQVAAGGFVGASNAGSYKLFGRAVAKANCYDRSLTILEFLVSRKKTSSSTETRLYANVMGITLKNVYLTEDASVCKSIEEPLYEGREYTVFDFTYSIFVVVGTLNFRLTATVQFTTGMYVEFCDNHGSVTVGAGLSPTLTIRVSASGYLEILWVARAGLTLTATFNYQILPEVSSELCYKESQVRVKNCLGVYHQWADNTLDLYAWYAWRGWCGWWACTGSDAYRDIHRIDSLSFNWDLPGTNKLTIWEVCDQDYTC